LAHGWRDRRTRHSGKVEQGGNSSVPAQYVPMSVGVIPY
jgi:hypothetical protein